MKEARYKRLHSIFVVQLFSRVWLFATPWTIGLQASLSAISQSLPKLMSIESVIPSNHLLFCHPLFLLPSIVASIRAKHSLPRWGSDKESDCQAWDSSGCDPWVRKNPWRRKWQPTPIFLPGKFHEQRSLADYSPWSPKEWDTTEHRTHTHTHTMLLYSSIQLQPCMEQLIGSRLRKK